MARKKAEVVDQAEVQVAGESLQEAIQNTDTQVVNVDGGNIADENQMHPENNDNTIVQNQEAAKDNSGVISSEGEPQAQQVKAGISVPQIVEKEDAAKTKQAPSKETNENKTSKETEIPEPEISDEVKSVLKRFPDEKELYVDKFGGVYTKDTQSSLVKNATLYKNPFYNK